MRKLAAVFVLTILASCASPLGKDLVQDFGVGIQRNLSIDDINRLKQMCVDNAAVIVASVDPKAPKPLQDVGFYSYNFCKQLLTNQQNNVDEGSLAWLPDVIAKIGIVSKALGFVLVR